MRSVLFIHGFGGDRRQYQPIIRFLQRNGFSRFYEFEYQPKHGQVPIAEIVQQLSTYIRQNIREEEIDCVAISQGGIIARYFVQHHHPRLIRRCITLCSPHHGSFTSYLLPRKGLRDLRPGSALLQQLNQADDDTEYFCVWTPFDLMVVPGHSGRLLQAKRNLRVWSLLHPLAFTSRTTLRFILTHLST